MNKGPVLIIGALGDIGKSVAHQFASKGYDIQLAGRRLNELEAISNDIKFISIPDIEYGMKILIDVKIVKIIIMIKSTLPKFSGMILKGFKTGSVNFTTI